jgi:hypothetical protein
MHVKPSLLICTFLGWLLGVAGPALGAEPAAPKLHAIVAVDTLARNAEKLGITLDGARMQVLLQKVFDDTVRDQRVSITLLAGVELTPEAFLKTIYDLPSKPNDTILVYYSGHGGTEGAAPKDLFTRLPDGTIEFLDVRKEEKKHFLAMSSGSVTRANVIQVLHQKSCRLAILLTDCCANYTRTEAGSIGKGPDTKTILHKNVGGLSSTDPSPNQRGLQTLFFQNCGFVDANASHIGEIAIGNTRFGGFFTYGLVRASASDDKTFAGLKDTNNSRWGPFLTYCVSDEMQRLSSLPDSAEEWQTFRATHKPVTFSDSFPVEESFYDPRLGILVARWYKELFVIKVMPGGAAFKAGLRGVYDLHAIDDRQFTSLADVSKRWPAPGKQARFRIHAATSYGSQEGRDQEVLLQVP